ncbi:PfkB family carbohydrate kinase [Nanoarchaeota archaeon]
MAKTIIIGTIGLDTIETPFGKKEEILGGSATYAAYAASFFTQPGMVAAAGEDLPKDHTDLLIKKGIDIKGVKKQGKTFRWEGYYEYDMNEAKTMRTELNSLASFDAEIPQEFENAEYVFLANIDPELQLKALEQFKNPQLIVMDTMNFWIDNKKDKLIEVIKKTDILLINDGEARQLFETTNLVKAANAALKLGPKAVIIKKGEHGALLFCDDKHFSAGGYPLEDIKDPTGCGDSFGGGLIGYLAKTGDHSEKNLRKAVVYGSVIASFNAEDFSLDNLKKVDSEKIEKRFHEFKAMREF